MSFAPIGLLDMFNSGGAVEEVEIHKNRTEESQAFDGEVESELTTSLSSERSATATIGLRVRGSGRFGMYCSQKPLKCVVGDVETHFDYDSNTGLVSFTIPVPSEDMYRWPIHIQV